MENPSQTNDQFIYDSADEALDHIRARPDSVLKSHKGKHEFHIKDLEGRVAAFKNGSRGILYIPSGDEVALRKSVLRELSFSNNLPELDLEVLKLSPGALELDGVDVAVEVSRNGGDNPQDYVKEIRFYRGYGVQPQHIPEIEDGLLINEVIVFLAACKKNLGAHQLDSNKSGLNMDQMTPKVIIVTPDPDKSHDRGKDKYEPMVNTGAGSLSKLDENQIIR